MLSRKENLYTYERSAIETWLNDNQTSPCIPSININASEIRPNVELRNKIELFVNELEKEVFENNHHTEEQLPKLL